MIQAKRALAEDIARELGVRVPQINAAIELFDKGATVPFIARYRKEITEGLTNTQLRCLHHRLDHFRELEARRQIIMQQLSEANHLTSELTHAIAAANTKAELEDLYLPYRPKRRTKALIALEAGLLPLADLLIQNSSCSPEQNAGAFISESIPTIDAALEGARQILIERFTESPALLAQLREILWDKGVLKAEALKSNKTNKATAAKFIDYVNYQEPIKKIPSHRALALFRGRREQVLQFNLILPDPDYGVHAILTAFNLPTSCTWLIETVRLAWKNRLFRSLETELFARLRELADEEAIQVFSRNLRALLLTAPAGHVVTMGLQPGFRAGIKIAVVNSTGQSLDAATVFPFAPDNAREEAITFVAKLIAKYHVEHISIGNGAGSREAAQLVAECILRYPDMTVKPIIVNEAGASVYSASLIAANELPDLDVTLRGAVSIARRLQDPLAELVKIDPQFIGVGQYQHDVNPVRLSQRLREVVEDCVNAVGVDLNLASCELLAYVSGFNAGLARQVVMHREIHGPFKNRKELLQVAGLDEKTFEQAAGFLRIFAGENPLDNSAVHPEAYPLVDKILADRGCGLVELIGNQSLLAQINADLITVKDILAELAHPGRDPRFKPVTPQLSLGMILEGVVSNVTNFGAFVNIGMHQDGLVHISAMRERFIRDPHQVLKVGDIVRVKVVEIDSARQRIGLSMRFTEEVQSKPEIRTAKRISVKKSSPTPRPTSIPFNTAMADAFSKLKRGSS